MIKINDVSFEFIPGKNFEFYFAELLKNRVYRHFSGMQKVNFIIVVNSKIFKYNNVVNIEINDNDEIKIGLIAGGG